MRDWQSRVEAAGANLFDDGLIVNETPNEEGIALCVELGETFARQLTLAMMRYFR